MIGVAAGSTLAFVADEVEEIHEVVVPRTGWQFRSRDAFSALLPGLLAGNTDLLAAPLTRQQLPVVPAHAVAYVDGYENLQTTWQELSVEAGTRVRVRVAGVEANHRTGAEQRQNSPSITVGRSVLDQSFNE